jgi:Phage tail lysozyme
MKLLALRLLAPCVLASAVVVLPGCGASSSDPDVSSSSAALSGNEEVAYKFFVAKGLKSYQSAGIVGNLIQESSVDPTIAQYGGGPGRGIAQWSEGGRWNASHDDNVEWYAAREHQSMDSLNLQLEFIWYELTTFGYGYDRLKDSSTLAEAEYAFQADYEICGECEQGQRLEYAQEVLDANGGSSSGDSAHCDLAGHTWAENTCTENHQCDNGHWVDRYDDSASCRTGIEPHGACLSDSGEVLSENTCTSTLQCDDGRWVDRDDDPSACR